MQLQMLAPAEDLRIPGAMRAVCLPLLLSLLCSRRALGLECYSCSGLQNSAHCRPDRCPEDYVCFKAMLSVAKGYGGEHEVTMEQSGCAPSCEAVSQNLQSSPWGPEPDLTMEGLTPPKLELKHVDCCVQNFCNKPGLVGHAPGPPAGALLLALALALLWALL